MSIQPIREIDNTDESSTLPKLPAKKWSLYKIFPSFTKLIDLTSFIMIDKNTNLPEFIIKLRSQAPIGFVVMLHGMESHHGEPSMIKLAESWSHAGLVAFSFDMQGHGDSGGVKGLIRSHKALYKDILKLVHLIRQDERFSFQKCGFFLAGRSLGGSATIIASLELQEDPLFLGSLLYAPAIIQTRCPSPVTICALRCFCAPCCPLWAPWFLKGSEERCYREPEVAEIAYADQRRWDGPTRLKTGDESLKLISKVRNSLSKIQFPFLLVQGDADKIVSVEGAHEMMKSSQTLHNSKQLHIVFGGWHALACDTRYGPPLLDISLGWIQERLKQYSPMVFSSFPTDR